MNMFKIKMYNMINMSLWLLYAARCRGVVSSSGVLLENMTGSLTKK